MNSRLLPVIVVIGLFGCSTPSDLPEIGKVSGMVSAQGQPVAGVQVAFFPTSGRPSYGTTGPDGRFSLLYLDGVQGAVLGNHRVSIQNPPATTATDAAPPPGTPLEWPNVLEVKSGTNEFDFDLTELKKPGAQRGTTQDRALAGSLRKG